MVLGCSGYPEKNGTNRKAVPIMSNTKTITVRKDLVYNVSLIRKTLAEQACCRAEDVPFENVLEFARHLSLLDMSDNPSSQYLDLLDEDGVFLQ
tara:strand:+ start:255 stop:536 length:282 start_codon:yes stop_codon:yes gene_type:complete